MKDKKENTKEQSSEKQESSKKKRRIEFSKPLVFVLIVLFLIAIVSAGIIYLNYSSSRTYVENSQISAPEIVQKPVTAGVLEKVFVKEGDLVKEDMTVAIVSGNPIKAKADGLVIYVNNVPGQTVSAADTIVKMIEPDELRVVGRLEENKGLSDVKVGQHVLFTADAFNSKNYYGEVELISPTSREGDIVFSISDKRQEQQFNIKVKYDVAAYPELKNGMSAKMWIYK